MSYFYKVIDLDTGFFKLESKQDFPLRYDNKAICEIAAFEFFNKHDGWEAGWPLTFALFKDKGQPEIARFEVEMEPVPEFYAKPKPTE